MKTINNKPLIDCRNTKKGRKLKLFQSSFTNFNNYLQKSLQKGKTTRNSSTFQIGQIKLEKLKFINTAGSGFLPPKALTTSNKTNRKQAFANSSKFGLNLNRNNFSATHTPTRQISSFNFQQNIKTNNDKFRQQNADQQYYDDEYIHSKDLKMKAEASAIQKFKQHFIKQTKDKNKNIQQQQSKRLLNLLQRTARKNNKHHHIDQYKNNVLQSQGRYFRKSIKQTPFDNNTNSLKSSAKQTLELKQNNFKYQQVKYKDLIKRNSNINESQKVKNQQQIIKKTLNHYEKLKASVKDQQNIKGIKNNQQNIKKSIKNQQDKSKTKNNQQNTNKQQNNQEDIKKTYNIQENIKKNFNSQDNINKKINKEHSEEAYNLINKKNTQFMQQKIQQIDKMKIHLNIHQNMPQLNQNMPQLNKNMSQLNKNMQQINKNMQQINKNMQKANKNNNLTEFNQQKIVKSTLPISLKKDTQKFNNKKQQVQDFSSKLGKKNSFQPKFEMNDMSNITSANVIQNFSQKKAQINKKVEISQVTKPIELAKQVKKQQQNIKIKTVHDNTPRPSNSTKKITQQNIQQDDDLQQVRFENPKTQKSKKSQVLLKQQVKQFLQKKTQKSIIVQSKKSLTSIAQNIDSKNGQTNRSSINQVSTKDTQNIKDNKDNKNTKDTKNTKDNQPNQSIKNNIQTNFELKQINSKSNLNIKQQYKLNFKQQQKVNVKQQKINIKQQKVNVIQQQNVNFDNQSFDDQQNTVVQQIFYLVGLVQHLGGYNTNSKPFYSNTPSSMVQTVMNHRLASYYISNQFYYYCNMFIKSLQNPVQQFYSLSAQQLQKGLQNQQVQQQLSQLKQSLQITPKLIKFTYQKCKIYLKKDQKQFQIDKDKNYHQKAIQYLKLQFKGVYKVYQRQNKQGGNLVQRLVFIIQIYTLLMTLNRQEFKQFEELQDIEQLNYHLHVQKYKHLLLY